MLRWLSSGRAVRYVCPKGGQGLCRVMDLESGIGELGCADIVRRGPLGGFSHRTGVSGIGWSTAVSDTGVLRAP